MNSNKSDELSPPPPPYTYATAQPTHSFTNPFSSNESSQLPLDKNEFQTTSLSIKNTDDTSCASFCCDVVKYCGTRVECILCCISCTLCFSACN